MRAAPDARSMSEDSLSEACPDAAGDNPRERERSIATLTRFQTAGPEPGFGVLSDRWLHFMVSCFQLAADASGIVVRLAGFESV